MIAPGVAVLEQYVFGDLAFVWFLMLLVFIDTALGFRLAWKNKRIASKAFSRVLDKLFVYLSLMTASYAIAQMGGAGEDSILFMSLRWLVVSYISIREFISIAEKSTLMGYGLPEWLMKHLRDYAEKGPNASDEGSPATPPTDKPDNAG